MSHFRSVRLYGARLSRCPGLDARLVSQLCAPELAESRQPASPITGRHLAHVMKRLVLARWLGAPPQALAFRQGAHGKPALHPNSAGTEFNLSHSGEGALLGVADGIALGVDLQRHRRVANPLAVAATAWPASVAAVPLADECDFFQRWTLVEALGKAMGTGLPGLQSVDCSFSRSGGIRGEWRLACEGLQARNVCIWDGYSAAICTPDGAGPGAVDLDWQLPATNPPTAPWQVGETSDARGVLP
jgi:phosphopantetheinyl transferase